MYSLVTTVQIVRAYTYFIAICHNLTRIIYLTEQSKLLKFHEKMDKGAVK